MSERLIAIADEEVPRGRGHNPFLEPVTEVAKRLAANPGVWYLIGKGEKKDRSRLNNATALLAGSKYKSLSEYYTYGRFEARVSGAKNAPHADQFPIGVYARFLKNGEEYGA